MQKNDTLIFEQAKLISNKINYSLDAIVFVMFIKRNNNCTFKDIIDSVIKKACNLYKSKAIEELKNIGIKSGKDIGEIFYAYVDEGIIKEESGDSRLQFENYFTESDKIFLFKKFLIIWKLKAFILNITFIIFSLIIGNLMIIVDNKKIGIPLAILAFIYACYLNLRKN